ncbi:MAG: leucine-rich repeat protein [Porcipelethomonas sp.]
MEKKRFLSFVTSAAMAVVCLGGSMSGNSDGNGLLNEPITAEAANYSSQMEYGDYLSYVRVDDDEDGFYDHVEITDCDTSAVPVEIPSEIDGMPVTDIGDSAFSYCSQIESITIPASVTSIGNGAFFNCTSLADVTIYDSVTTIGENAFSNCLELKNVIVPDSVVSIGKNAFYNCTSLESITIENPECDIYDSPDTIESTAIILGPEGSSAEDYAWAYERTFELLEEPAVSTPAVTTAVTIVSETVQTTVSAIPDTSATSVSVVTSIVPVTSYQVVTSYVPVISYQVVTSISIVTEVSRVTQVSHVTDVSYVTSVSLVTDIVTYVSRVTELSLVTSVTLVPMTSIVTQISRVTDVSHVTGISLVTQPSVVTSLAVATSVSVVTSISVVTSECVVTIISPVTMTSIYIVTLPTVVTSISNVIVTEISNVTEISRVTEVTILTEISQFTVTSIIDITVPYTTVSTVQTEQATECSDISQLGIIGDANQDGKLNIRDAAFIAQKLAQGKADELPDSADFNGDGVINVRDAAANAKNISSALAEKAGGEKIERDNGSLMGIKIGNAAGQRGETVSLPINVLCNNNFESAAVLIEWNDISLESSSAEAANGVSYASDAGAGYFSLAAYGSAAIADGTIVTIDFTIPYDAEEGTIYDIYFSDIDTFAEFDGDDMADVVAAIGGTIEVLPDPTEETTAAPTEPSVTTGTTASVINNNPGVKVEDVVVDYGTTEATLGVSFVGLNSSSMDVVVTITYPEELELISGFTEALVTSTGNGYITGTFINPSGWYNERFTEVVFAIPEDAVPGTVYDINVSVDQFDDGGEYVENPVGYSGSVTIDYSESVTTAAPTEPSVTTGTTASVINNNPGVKVEDVVVDYGTTEATLGVSFVGLNSSSMDVVVTITYPEELELISGFTEALVTSTGNGYITGTFINPSGWYNERFTEVVFAIPEDAVPGTVYDINVSVDQFDDGGEYVVNPGEYSGSVTIDYSESVTTAASTEPSVTTAVSTEAPVTTQTTVTSATTQTTANSDIFEIKENNGTVIIVDCVVNVINVIVPSEINDTIVSKINDFAFSSDTIGSVTFKNPNVEIADSETTINENAVICGYWDSTAHDYALKYDREFVSLDGEPDTLQGDANGDNIINVRDAAFIAQKLAQGKSGELPDSADYNGDGTINVRDAAAIAKYLATGEK